MTAPDPSQAVCNYDQPDTHARVGQNEDGTWFSVCNCLTTPCTSDTYDTAVSALNAHRGQAA